jgi:hypothetical protein
MATVVALSVLAALSWLAWSPLARTLKRVADMARRKKHDDDVGDSRDDEALLEAGLGLADSNGLGFCPGKGVLAVGRVSASRWLCCARERLGAPAGKGEEAAAAAVAATATGIVVRKLLPFVLPEKWWLVSGSAALALGTAMALGVPVLLRRVIDGVIVPASSAEVVGGLG